MADAGLDLDVHVGELAVCRLPADAEVPAWCAAALRRPMAGAPLVAVVRTGAELSLVVPAGVVPADGAEGLAVEAGWRALAVHGPLEFGLVGILAELAGCLASAGVSLFAVSTFDTDWLLVRGDDLAAAVAALRADGHRVHTVGDA